jgi:hypothetical protein
MLSGAVRSMSALGQKQTFATQKVMSALPPRADMKWQFATCSLDDHIHAL